MRPEDTIDAMTEFYESRHDENYVPDGYWVRQGYTMIASRLGGRESDQAREEYSRYLNAERFKYWQEGYEDGVAVMKKVLDHLVETLGPLLSFYQNMQPEGENPYKEHDD